MLEPCLNPALHVQAIGRVHRMGQMRPVRVTNFILKDSIESRVMTMLYSSGGAPKPGADQATAIDIDDDGPAVVAGTIQRDTPRLSLSDFNTLFDLSDAKTTADLIQDVTTTRAAHVKVKTAEDAKRGGPPVLRPPAAPKLPPASRKKKAPAKATDEDEWDEEDAVDVDAPPPKRRAGLRASARTRKAVVDLPSDPEDDPEDDESDSPDEVAKLRAEVARLEAENKKLNAREAPAPMDVGQAARRPARRWISRSSISPRPQRPRPAPAAPMIVRIKRPPPRKPAAKPAAAPATQQAGQARRGAGDAERRQGPRGLPGQRHAGRAAGEAGARRRDRGEGGVRGARRAQGEQEVSRLWVLRRRRRFHRRVEAGDVRHRLGGRHDDEDEGHGRPEDPQVARESHISRFSRMAPRPSRNNVAASADCQWASPVGAAFQWARREKGHSRVGVCSDIPDPQGC